MNPFKEGSKDYHDYQVLSDLKWHCAICELKSGQAKTWQTWRDELGIQFEEPTERRWVKSLFCNNCKRKTSHRKLLTLDQLDVISVRSGVSPSISKKIKQIYNNEEAFFLRKMSPTLLEADHKFPQIRWNQDEDSNDGLNDNELKNKFILLTRANNLWKSRQCEKCFKTGERGAFPGIYFWWKGDKEWDSNINIHNEEGCVGCFWHNPYKWREELNKRVR